MPLFFSMAKDRDILMHELPVMKSILDIVVRQAHMHKVKKVRAIELEVGMLSDLETEWMQRYFNHLSKGTIAEEAELRIEWFPVIFKCQECDKSFEEDIKKISDVVCPHCGKTKLTLVSGREYRIRNMEVE